ncbi:MAG: YqgE/AlgH family protein [Pseudomonadota bacterium]
MPTADFSLAGQFLIAMPDLAGSYFGATLTLMCEHDDQGALGLVVNRPTNVGMDQLFDELDMTMPEHLDDAPPTVYEGGPVGQERGFVLHRSAVVGMPSLEVTSDIYLSGASEILRSVAFEQPPADYLVLLGYAGWGAGQLEEELKDNAWLTCPATSEIVFEAKPEARIQKAAAQLGVDYALLAAPGHA